MSPDKSKIYRSSKSKEVRENINKRLAFKRKIDRIQKFSAEDLNKSSYFLPSSDRYKEHNWTRLISEGVLVDTGYDGEPIASYVIGTGVIKSMYDNLSKDFVGFINKDHERSIYLGTFTKDDLRLVEIENGRFALDVNVRLDHQLNAVADLLREDQHRAISVELGLEDATLISASELGIKIDEDDFDYPVVLVNKATLQGYGVVRSPKDPNAYNEELLSSEQKGDKMAELDKKVDIEAEEEKKTEAINIDDKKEELADVEFKTDENSDEKELESEKDNTSDEPEESKNESTDEPNKAEDKSADEPHDLVATGSNLSKLGEAIDQLKATITEKDEKIAELERKLSEQSIANMSTEEVTARLLARATICAKTQSEGAKLSASEANSAEQIVESVQKAFANL